MNLLFRLLWTAFISRFRKTVPILGPCHTPFTVLPTDLDVLLHLNNGVYFSLMDLARVDLMVRTGLWKKLNKGGYYPVIALETIQFQRSLEPFQRFHIETTVLGWDTKAIYLQQRFVRKGKLHATAIVSSRFLQKKKGVVTPDEILHLFDPSLQSPTLPTWIEEWSKNMRELREK